MLELIRKETKEILTKVSVVADAVWQNRQRIFDAAKRTPHVCLHATEIVISLLSDTVTKLQTKVTQCVECGYQKSITTPTPVTPSIPPTDTAA